MRRLAALFVVAVLGAGGCGGDDEPAAPTAPGLDGRSFRSTAIDGRELVPGTQVTLRFDDGTLGAQAGCNTISGGYEIADDVLRWSTDPATTGIGCDPALHRQDDWLAGFLGDARLSRPAGDGLVLRGGGVELTLEDERRAHPPLPVVGTSWTLDTIAAGNGPDDSAASVPAGVRAPTLRFTEDDRVELFAGCNSGGGRAVVGDDGFAEIGPLTLTRKACERAAMETERAVTSILAGRVALGFSGEGDLSVAKGGRHLLFRAG